MFESARLPRSEHDRHPWRIHTVAKDFRIEDVWALPTPGGPEDFPRLVDVMTSFDPERTSPVLRALFALRWKLGALFGLDPDGSAFRPVYEADREAAFEISNRTVRGIMHLGWVPDGHGGFRGQMAVLVKPNGVLGRTYMAAIAPFRYALVYPLMLRAIGRAWGDPVTQVPVPEFVPQLSMLPRVDYSDAFVVAAAGHPDRSAEQWARAILEHTGASAQLHAAWTALGLRVDDENGVAGWRLRRNDPDTVLLGADSRVGMPGELLIALRGGELVFATMLSHRTPATRPVWAAVESGHLAKVRQLLTLASESTADAASG